MYNMCEFVYYFVNKDEPKDLDRIVVIVKHIKGRGDCITITYFSTRTI